MLKIVKTVLLFSFLCQSVLVEADDLEIKLLGGGKKEVEAGANINLMMTITNRSETDKNIQIRFGEKDANWKFLADYSSIRVEKKTSFNKIVGVHVPDNFSAGDYSIALEALENPILQSFGEIKVPIAIKPRYEITIDKLKAPQYLFSGDTLSIRYLIQNLSNLEVSVKTTIINGSQSKVKYVQIPKDSSILSSCLVSAPKDIITYSQKSVVLMALVADKPETEKSVFHTFDVFPTGKNKFDKYNRFPVKIAGLVASTNRYGGNLYSTMYDIHGEGMLGKNNDKKLEIQLRGPDRTGNPIFGMNDEYFLKYSSPKFQFDIGDNNFSLSELTESSRNGRGAQAQYKLKKWSLSTYYNKPRYYPLIKQIYSVSTNYDFNEKNGLSVGFLSKTDSTNKNQLLYTLSGDFSPYPWVSSNLEVAAGQYETHWHKAYKATILMHYKIVSSNFNYTYADRNFPGFVTNTLRLFYGFNLNFSKFNLSLNYDQNSTNLALDTLYSNAPISKNLSVSAGYRLSPNNTISFACFMLSLKDKSPVPLFDYLKYNGRVAIQSKFGSVSLALQGDFGKMQNFLGVSGNEFSNFYNGTLSLGYQLGRVMQARAFASYQGGKEMITGFDRLYYGGSIVTSIKDKLSLSIQYNSNYEWRYYTMDRSLFSMSLNGKINDNNEVSLSANQNLVKNTLDTKEYNLQLRYIHTLNVPVSKKRDVGSMKGKIINHGVGKVSGIRMSLNGMVAITDKEGNFKFPGVQIGSYMLGMDASSFGLNAIPEVTGPYWITIKAAEETTFEIAMTKSGSIVGQLIIQEDERTGQKGYIPVKEQIEGLIIEAANGSDVFRNMSSSSGTFRFDDLRPGSWEVKVYPNGLPQGYQLVNDHFNINLLSGKEVSLDVLVKKQVRQIRFQKSTTTKK
jgi:hypothetical protein